MSNSTASAALRIEGEMTIYRASELKQALLTEPAPSEIDLSGVTDIDTVGVQLLILAKREAQANQRELRLVAHSPAVADVFELLGLASIFDDPLVMDSRESATRPSSSAANPNSNAGRRQP